MDLLDAFEIEERTREIILKAPFSYPGGKSRSVEYILPHLPYRGSYIEPFGGAASVLLSRNKSRLEVYNDRYGGVVEFYRCLRDETKYKKMISYLQLCPHSRQEFLSFRDNWQTQPDDVLRAAMWYYTICYSFSSLGRNFGRIVEPASSMATRFENRLESLHKLHNRIRHIQIENLDWSQCLKDFDNKDAVFYCDPPYVDAYEGAYAVEMSHEEHKRFIDSVFSCAGFVAVSGYNNPLYDNQPWDNKYTWKSRMTIQGFSNDVNNNRETLENPYTQAEECLWIKE